VQLGDLSGVIMRLESIARTAEHTYDIEGRLGETWVALKIEEEAENLYKIAHKLKHGERDA
jgi:hypothetical protein